MVSVLVTVFSFLLFAEPKHELQIRITGVEHASGSIMLAIYDPSREFLGEDIYLAHELELKVGEDHSFTTSLPAGRYAISVFHDVNGDKKLNTNLLGIPKEPYGFSITRGTFGPPSFEEASFKVPEANIITIEVD